MDVDNKIFFDPCRRNMLLHFNKFPFLSVIYVINFSEKGPEDSAESQSIP